LREQSQGQSKNLRTMGMVRLGYTALLAGAFIAGWPPPSCWLQDRGVFNL